MQKIIPNIWCNRNAEEAGKYYAATFQNTTCAIEARYPTTVLVEFQQEFAGEPLTVSVSMSGYRLSLINAGSEFRPTPALSFMLNFDPLAVDGDDAATEQVIVVAEIERSVDEAGRLAIRSKVVAGTREAVGFLPRDVVFVAPGEIPRTPTGKIQYDELRRLLASDAAIGR